MLPKLQWVLFSANLMRRGSKTPLHSFEKIAIQWILGDRIGSGSLGHSGIQTLPSRCNLWVGNRQQSCLSVTKKGDPFTQSQLGYQTLWISLHYHTSNRWTQQKRWLLLTLRFWSRGHLPKLVWKSNSQKRSTWSHPLNYSSMNALETKESNVMLRHIAKREKEDQN